MGRRGKRQAASSPADARPGRGRLLAAILVVAAAAALAWFTWQPEAPAPTTAAERGTPPPPAAAGAYAALVGEWVRPDGGYVLAVSRVAADGTATAGYFNPRSIHVARAEAKREGEHVGLFVELRDVNYPGSTYSLAYDTATDELRGIYYQAAQGAQYEVVFSRRR